VPLLITPYTPHLYFERSPQRDAHQRNFPQHVTVTLISASPHTNATLSALHTSPSTAGGTPTYHPLCRIAIHQHYPLSAAYHTINNRWRTNTRPYFAAAPYSYVPQLTSVCPAATTGKCNCTQHHYLQIMHIFANTSPTRQQHIHSK
jgi:hypothetical protein